MTTVLGIITCTLYTSKGIHAVYTRTVPAVRLVRRCLRPMYTLRSRTHPSGKQKPLPHGIFHREFSFHTHIQTHYVQCPLDPFKVLVTLCVSGVVCDRYIYDRLGITKIVWYSIRYRRPRFSRQTHVCHFCLVYILYILYIQNGPCSLDIYIYICTPSTHLPSLLSYKQYVPVRPRSD